MCLEHATGKSLQKLFEKSTTYLVLIRMKAEDSKKRKASNPKKDDKAEKAKDPSKEVAAPETEAKAPPKEEPAAPADTGLLSKLKFPELPVNQAIGIPLAILVIALLITGFTMLTAGTPLHLGVDFTGGTLVTITTDHTDDQLKTEFASYPVNLISDNANGQKTIRFDTMSASQQDALSKYVDQQYPGSALQHTGSTISSANQVQAVEAIAVAFVGMAIVIFIIFRSFIPCVAVITSAFSDIMIAVALMNLFHIELSFGTFAALLMLIGYSVDTDILLTTKVLGERKYIDKKISTVRITGLTMTITAIAAFLVLHIFSTYDFVLGMAPITVLSAISTVMIFGLLADIMNTWLLNAGLLKWYMGTPEAKVKYG